MLTFRYRRFTFNSNKSPTWCNNFSVYYPDVCLQLNMFRAFFRPSSGAQWLLWQPLVLPSYRGDIRAVFVVGPAGPTTNTSRLWFLVYVTLYKWLFVVQVWMRVSSSIQSDIYHMSYWNNLLFWWWAHGCPKHVENRNKRTRKRVVRQVGYLQRLHYTIGRTYKLLNR
jgi:hypothetical protein